LHIVLTFFNIVLYVKIVTGRRDKSKEKVKIWSFRVRRFALSKIFWQRRAFRGIENGALNLQ